MYANTNPDTKLIIMKYLDRIYYCRVAGSSTQDEQVYYEREISAYKAPTNKSFTKNTGTKN